MLMAGHRRVNTPTPSEPVVVRVSEGTRTPDLLSHSQAL